MRIASINSQISFANNTQKQQSRSFDTLTAEETLDILAEIDKKLNNLRTTRVEKFNLLNQRQALTDLFVKKFAD